MTELAVENLLAGLDGRPMPHPARLMRVAVVDIGTNSTRLLIADVAPDGSLASSSVGQPRHPPWRRRRLDAELSPEAIARVFGRARRYAQSIEHHDADVRTAVLTSAVRDSRQRRRSSSRRCSERYGLEARAIPGDEEAQLTFLGAMSGPDEDARARD